MGFDRMKACGLDFPDELHYAVQDQVWARLHDDGSATVGITALGIRLAGEVYMCRPKAVGTEVERGRSIAVVELAKSIVSVKCPVSGRVCEINPRLAQTPELVHLDPYAEGWIARLQLQDRPVTDQGLPGLVHGDAVAAAMEEHAWLHRES
jgi:glycine cleavage system H protein